MKVVKILLIVLYLFLGFLILYLSRVQDKLDTKFEVNTEAMKEIEQVALKDISVVEGQEIYVPAYSNIKSPDGKSDIWLSVNLSIRNTDPDKSIIISYLDFYNTEGNISKKFIENPVKIGPMATKFFYISRSDTSGGAGANFYLKWIADTRVNEPVVEAIMMGSAGNHGYTWSSTGLVVKRIENE